MHRLILPQQKSGSDTASHSQKPWLPNRTKVPFTTVVEYYEGDVPLPGAPVWRDGLPRSLPKRAHQGAQDFAADRQPHLNERDVRHNGSDPFVSASDQRLAARLDTHLRGRVKESAAAAEDASVGMAEKRCRMYHLVHAWHAQGTSVDDEIAPSTNMTVNASQLKLEAATHYLKPDLPVTYLPKISFRQLRIRAVSDRFSVVFPDYHERYMKAFKAGCALPLDDPGPFIGRAIVWKLQVLSHLDGLDAGTVGMSPEGSYEDGELIFSDFKRFGMALKFRYAPADLCFAHTGVAILYGWSLTRAVNEQDALNNLTAGRVSHVFFFPQKSLETLEKHGSGWSRDTAGGLLSSAAGR
ncbi:hypothetical protein GGX14DRAFT_569659 [Mycena pura]|uniref:Uncharacterized protein n=1 Tax=Mycena pura TaxID=153505 RepID=A0AAD6YBI5_9AGAR|nr:hypothetical protein GGX14DRAFT_569659 [Mycena pura]